MYIYCIYTYIKLKKIRDFIYIIYKIFIMKNNNLQSCLQNVFFHKFAEMLNGEIPKCVHFDIDDAYAEAGELRECALALGARSIENEALVGDA